MSPPPISTADIQRVLALIDESPTRALSKLTVHELREIADVLREYLRLRSIASDLCDQDDDAAKVADRPTCDLQPLREWLGRG